MAKTKLTTGEKQKQGKKNKATGKIFELKVRKDLESKGWIVTKWSNQVELEKGGKLIPAKHKFNFFYKCMTMGTGFPDFVAYKPASCNSCQAYCRYKVIGVEAKSKGYLDKAEKEKVKWLLDNHVFYELLVASKDKKKRGAIVYTNLNLNPELNHNLNSTGGKTNDNNTRQA